MLLNNRQEEYNLQIIGFPTMQGFDFVEINDIIRAESARNYTTFYLNNNHKIVVSRSLKEFEGLLSDAYFFRVHQSHLVNLKYIRQFRKAEGGELVMSDNSVVPVAKRKKTGLLKMLRIPK